jgi:hypothetical protein
MDDAQFFLLDIQNDAEGEEAGIELAERIVRYHWAKKTGDSTTGIPPIMVVVWSASEDHEKKAADRLWALVRSLDPHSANISMSAHPATKQEWIKIDVRSKYSQLYFH